MSLRFLRITLLSLLVFIVLFSYFLSFAQENLDEVCQWEKIEKKPGDFSDEEYGLLLKKCQKYYQQKSDSIEQDILKTEQEKNTLKNKITILANKIKSLDYQIYQGNIMVKDLTAQIEDTRVSIDKLNIDINGKKESLANLLQLRYEEDEKSTIEIFLAEDSLGDFFDNLMALESLNFKTQDLLKNIKSLKNNLGEQKSSMEKERGDLERLVIAQNLQKKESTELKKNQEDFLRMTEAEYQRYLKEKEETEKRVAEIGAKILDLIGARESVSYKEALEVARYAALQAGIRPALLLGVLSQESAIGKNVGQCYLKNPKTGEGVVVYSGNKISRVMNPQRDVPHFLQIIKELNKNRGLNLDPFKELVSCPMSFGWGGAMGPAQFIPSTWVLYKSRVETIIKESADPWNIRDASLAASIYLKDGILKYGTEGKAVQSYFCGYPKNDYWCSWYERNVMYLTRCHQDFIDKGVMSQSCQEAVGLK